LHFAWLEVQVQELPVPFLLSFSSFVQRHVAGG
jgi:hypothetical protein